MQVIISEIIYPKNIQIVWITILLCLTESCSLRFPDSRKIPFHTLYVEEVEKQKNPMFLSDLQHALLLYCKDIQVTQDLDKSEARLEDIKHKKIIRKIPTNILEQFIEYELFLTISFQLIDSKGKILIPETTLSTSRRIFCEDSENQARNEQIESSFFSMQKEVVQLLVYRITAIKINHPPFLGIAE